MAFFTCLQKGTAPEGLLFSCDIRINFGKEAFLETGNQEPVELFAIMQQLLNFAYFYKKKKNNFIELVNLHKYSNSLIQCI